jgi:hypothetical protein
MGVGAIKVDCGEAAPFNGVYASGRSGLYEHNLYPLRYNKAVADITRQVNGENLIWARSAWAGSQRYPLHWCGDSATTDIGLSSTLRGGLSFGLSGFTFWSHDIGGFMGRTPEDLYSRWVPVGMLTSHSRSHGLPPREPWEFGEKFTAGFRRAVEMRYRLLPYIYAQAKDSSSRGLPMLRALFLEFPDDAGSWSVRMSTCSAATSWWHRSSKPGPRVATSSSLQETGSITRPVRCTARAGTRSKRERSPSTCWCGTAPPFRTSRLRNRRHSWTGPNSTSTCSRVLRPGRPASSLFPTENSSSSGSRAAGRP